MIDLRYLVLLLVFTAVTNQSQAQGVEKYDTSFYSQDTLFSYFDLRFPDRDTLQLESRTINIEINQGDTVSHKIVNDTLCLYNVVSSKDEIQFEVDGYSKETSKNFLGQDTSMSDIVFPRIEARYCKATNEFRFDNKNEIKELIKKLYAVKLNRDSLNGKTEYHKYYYRDIEIADSSILQKNIFLNKYLIIFENQNQAIPINDSLKYAIENSETELVLVHYIMVHKDQNKTKTVYKIQEDLSKDRSLHYRSTKAMAELFKDSYPPDKWEEKVQWLNGLSFNGYDLLTLENKNKEFDEYIHYTETKDKIKGTTEAYTFRLKVIGQ